mmetsp:Transcript_11389/g.28742  ORF Transcript_11389/g.28742 Transcript_11389/m.28742 type:complete len:382 (-) Transcript_11389:36-1181(-)
MTTPSVHGALLLTQLCWGSAAVVNKLGLTGAGISPLVFALIREACASPILILLLLVARRGKNDGGGKVINEDAEKVDSSSSEEVETKHRPCKKTILRILPGIFIFTDQLCSLTGTMLADPVSAAAWQPSQVVFTLMISVCLRMENCSVWKILSMLLTVAGALCLVFLSGHNDSGQSEDEHSNHFAGQVFFLLNCLASSLEVIVWRKLLSHASNDMAHFAVMAESYLIAACCMAVACVSVSFSPKLVDFLCPKCNGDPWHVPPSALLSITYSVIFQTIIAYLAQAWALRYAPASLASLYATAQPIMAAAVTILLLVVGLNPGGVLGYPGFEMVGAFFIITGLIVAEFGSRKAADSSSKGVTHNDSSETEDEEGSASDSVCNA